MCHSPEKKENKNPRQAHPSASPSPPLSVLLRAPHARVAAAGHPRATCRRSSFRASLSAPVAHSPSPLAPVPDRPSSPTLAPVPLSIAATPSFLPAADSPPSVSLSPIPCTGSSLSPSSSDSGVHPALSPPLQGSRRAGPPAAAPARRATRPPQFLAVQPAVEARRHLRIAVRTSPSPLRPRLVAPHRAAAHARARAHRATRATPWPRPRRGQGRPRLDPAWWAAGPWALPISRWASRLGVHLAIFVRVSLGLFEQQSCKIHRN